MSTHEEGWIDPAKDAAHVQAVLAQGGFKVAVATPYSLTRAAEKLGLDNGRAALPPPAASVPAPSASRVRKVKAVSIANLTPAVVSGTRPRFEWVDPATLLIDEAYQRNLSKKSFGLIRKIVAAWDWNKFTPPKCAETGAGYHMMDGQHGAIAAASHPSIGLIPIQITEAKTQAQRAMVFVGCNTDRVGMTAMQIYFAAVTGGDPEACAIHEACRAAGVNVLRVAPGNGAYKPGDTIAVAEIGRLITRRGADKAQEILSYLVAAGVGPINAGMIKAIDHLLHDPEYLEAISPEAIMVVLTRDNATLPGQASVFAATHRVPVWKAMASVIFRGAPKRRRLAGAFQ